jgi:hypothetical protein
MENDYSPAVRDRKLLALKAIIFIAAVYLKSVPFGRVGHF